MPAVDKTVYFYLAYFDVMTKRLQHSSLVSRTSSETTLCVDARIDMEELPELWQSGIYICRVLCTEKTIEPPPFGGFGYQSDLPSAVAGVASPPFHITPKPTAVDTRAYLERYVHRSLLSIAAGQARAKALPGGQGAH